MARPTTAPERREQILQGLMRAMAKRGYRGAPVTAIAREAGLAPGLVHYYFESKQAILIELLRAIHQTVLERFDERLARAGDDPWARLFALTDALLEEDQSSEADAAAACWVAIAAEAVHEPAVRAAWCDQLAELVARLAELLRPVLRAEGRSVRGAESMASAVAAAVQGIHQMDAAAPALTRDRHPGTSAPALRHMIRGLVLAARPSRAGAPRRGARRR
jgi:TetR/AcrR family transcriptional repressor of bet genes